MATLRERVERLEDMVAALQRYAVRSGGGFDLLVVPFVEKAYPTKAKSVFACAIVDPTGQEKEGDQATISAAGNGVVYVANVGNVIPQAGQPYVATTVANRFVMQV